MRCLICGSRSINDYELLKQVVLESNFNITEVVSGCANGVDRLGEQLANERQLKIHKFPAEWDRHGKYAGFLRNKQMINFVSPPNCLNGCVIALWDGQSKGTAHTIKLAKAAKIPCFIKSL